MKKVFIDCGHGGSDSGAVACGLVERDINLVTSLATKEVLERHGVQVMMSRGDNSTFVGLSERCAMANNWGADLFVSEHENAGGGNRGEVIHSIYHGTGEILANNIAEEFKNIGQTQVNNYSKQGANGDYYAVIRGTNMPAVITEGCFLDNEVDNDIIDTIEEQKTMGVAIAKGILKTLGIAYIQPSQSASIDGKVGTVIASVLNVRSGDGTNYSIIGKLTKGQNVKLYQKRGNWIETYYGDHGGWVSADYIKY